MKQTEHYGLSQWELTDRILMEDFNADNLKIAQALAGKLDRAELFYTLGSPSEKPSGNLSLNLAVIPWADWEFVALHVSFREGMVPEENQIKVSLNNGSPVLGTFPWNDFFLLFWSGHNLEKRVRGLFLGPQASLILPKYTYGDLIDLSIDKVAEDGFPKSRFDFYGLR